MLVSKLISESSFAANSASPSPAAAFLELDVENAAAYCLWAGFHVDDSREDRAAGVLIEEDVSLEMALGATRANDLMESMMKPLKWWLNMRLEVSCLIVDFLDKEGDSAQILFVSARLQSF